MSDTITQTGFTESAPVSATASVQPREITESAFRALFAAGADPAEAQDGGLAVLRAEVETKSGLALLEKLLADDWTRTAQAASTRSTQYAGVTIHELDCPEQPVLRSALELIDLAASGNAEEIRVSRSMVARIPRELWNDLLLRRSASLQRTIIVAVSSAAGTEYISVHNGAVTVTAEPPNKAVTASLLPPALGQGTVVLVLPGTAELSTLDASIPQNALKVREPEWNRIYQLSRTYLMADQ